MGFRALAFTLACFMTISAQAVEVVIGAGGDFAFSDNHIRKDRTPPELHPEKVWDWGDGEATFKSLTSRIEGLFWGSDLNFLNLETALSTSKQGLRSPKTSGFAFVAHPNGVRHMIENLNVNLFSVSNNHINDFGQEGMRRTREQMELLKRQYPYMNFHGIRAKDEKIAPVEFTVANGVRVAFAAINIGNSGAGGSFSLIGVNNDSEYRTLIQAFKQSKADLKILSIHYGTETQVNLNQGQAARYRYAVDHGGVNLVLGHHPHVIRPVEIYKGSVIYYSLGNFLITGAANIDHRTIKNSTNPDHYRNYSIFSKTYFEISHGKTEVKAIKAVPLKGMHWRPYVPEAKVGATNISYLNKLNQSEIGKGGVQFKITSDGSGVYCSSGRGGPRAQEICR